MRRKLWPKAPTKEGALGQMSKNFQVYLTHINFLRNETKKFTIEPKNYTAMLLYLFFDSLSSTCQKKMETEKWSKAADSPLLISRTSLWLIFSNFTQINELFVTVR